MEAAEYVYRQGILAYLHRIACALEEIRDELRKLNLKALRKEEPTQKKDGVWC